MIPAVVSTGVLVAGIGHIAWMRRRAHKARVAAQIQAREELRCQTLAHAIRQRERAQRVQIVGDLADLRITLFNGSDLAEWEYENGWAQA